MALEDMGKRVVVDEVLKQHPEMDRKVLMKMSMQALLGLIPQPEEVKPLESEPDFDPKSLSYVGQDGNKLPHRRRSASIHRRRTK